MTPPPLSQLCSLYAVGFLFINEQSPFHNLEKHCQSTVQKLNSDHRTPNITGLNFVEQQSTHDRNPLGSEDEDGNGLQLQYGQT